MGNRFKVSKKLLDCLNAVKLKDNLIYVYDKGHLFKAAIFDEHYYQLKLYNNIPILEIDGLRMHLIKSFSSPLDYAKVLVKYLKPYGKVLETCGGLGYITRELIHLCDAVFVIEKSKPVIELAKINPYSKVLFSNKKVKLINADAFDFLERTKQHFNFIIHDPPRLSLAPNLYSLNFYKLVYTHLVDKGKFYHYIGSLGKRRGRNISKEIKSRLKDAGFEDIRYIDILQGLICRK